MNDYSDEKRFGRHAPSPGTWVYNPFPLHENAIGCVVNHHDDHFDLVVNLGDGGNGINTQIANGKLIAAAPTMYTFLSFLREQFERPEFVFEDVKEDLLERIEIIQDLVAVKSEDYGAHLCGHDEFTLVCECDCHTTGAMHVVACCEYCHFCGRRIRS
jgi:hypothetical protein